ncbi:hypothetical protein ACRWQL_00405 (plasmid) [Shewanella sp. HL-SH4]|uniref:hypothetical protein n=1 Tax=Shewanella sp. HL-SH4 TaxID=3436240 RepID=UPI003EBBF71F
MYKLQIKDGIWVFGTAFIMAILYILFVSQFNFIDVIVQAVFSTGMAYLLNFLAVKLFNK